MGEWEEKTLNQLGRITTGKTPPTSRSQNYGGVIPFVTPSDFDGRRIIQTTERYLSDEGAEMVSGCLIPAKAIMVSCIGSDMGKAAIAAGDCITNQQINSIVIDSDNDPLFVYYNLSMRKAEIRAMASGSAQPILNKSSFGRLKILLPSSSTQRAIVHILGTLDDKIELNRQMNQTLEQMAQAIFKSWFIDFDPVHAKAQGRETGLPKEIADLFPDSLEDSELGKIPRGWRVVTFEELVTAKQGKYIQREEMSEHATVEYLYPVYGGNGIRGYSRECMYSKPVLVLTCRGSNCGLIDLTESAAWVSNIAFACVPKIGSTHFLHVYFLHSSFAGSISGSAQPQITYTALKNKIMQHPVAETICDLYSVKTEKIFEQIADNMQQSKNLAILRDTLLPKLISGELEIPDVEKILEGVE